MDTKFQMVQLHLSNADSEAFKTDACFRLNMIGEVQEDARKLLCDEQNSAVWAIHGHGAKLASGRVERLAVKCEVRPANIGDFCFGIVRKYRSRKVLNERSFNIKESDKALAWALNVARECGHKVVA